MGLFTEKYNTPFDTEEMRSRPDFKPSAQHVKPAQYLSTRASLFLGYTLISLCAQYTLEGTRIWWPLLCAAAIVLVWSLTMRFFMRPKWSAVSFILTTLLGTAACEVSYRLGWCGKYAGALFVPMAIGIMSLSRFKKDDEEEFARAGFGDEVLLPFALAGSAALFGGLASGLFERTYLFTSILSAVSFLILISWSFSKITSSPHRATSKALTEFWDIPVADFQSVKRFVIARSCFVLVLVLVCGALIGIRLIPGFEYARLLSVPLAAVLATLISMILIAVAHHGMRRSIFGLRYFVSETAIGSQFMVMFFLGFEELPPVYSIPVVTLFALLADIVLTGLLAVIRRRLIFVSKSKYIDGLPFYLVLTALVTMLVETCLYSLPGL